MQLNWEILRNRTVRRVGLRDGVPKYKCVLRDDQSGLDLKPIPPPHLTDANCSDSAAMVFEAAAGHSPRSQAIGPGGRLSLLKPRHLLGSHTKTLRPIVSQTSKRGLTCPVFERT